ncbi:MAG: diacylglycerol kinase family protein [Saprospiraceae bacterium]|nr:diacylglycerol kinase family protein [Saprospiraceae bacterium]
MNSPPYTFIHRLKCACHGIGQAVLHERHFRVHFVLFVLVILAGWLTGLSTWEWVAICGISGLVMGLELVNAALEQTLDLLHPDQHPRVGMAKDMAAGAVLIAACFAILIAIFIFIPHWLH